MEGALAQKSLGEYGDDQEYESSVATFLDWKPVLINERHWISYKTEQGNKSISHIFLWRTPVSDQHYLTFSFPTDHYRGRADDVVEAMKNFSTQIMQSVKITFPDWVLRLKAEAQEKWPDEQYSPTKEPLRWIREDPPPMRFDEASYNARHGITDDTAELQTDDLDIEVDEQSK